MLKKILENKPMGDLQDVVMLFQSGSIPHVGDQGLARNGGENFGFTIVGEITQSRRKNGADLHPVYVLEDAEGDRAWGPVDWLSRRAVVTVQCCVNFSSELHLEMERELVVCAAGSVAA
ncbi:MAG: hypothetical protein M1383_00905 [Patescibacteria group bacterium]|nr:hypothetical protein [Patescibacteria group bacterium]